MGIFSKLGTLIKSNINDLINRAEDPEKMLNQIILDMRDQLAKAKREVAGAIADERKLRAQLDSEAKQTREWERRAVMAVRQSRDDLAKQALMRQQEHNERVSSLDQAWRAQAAETEKLKGSLRQLNDKIEEARRKRNLLIAKQKRAQAQRRIHETMSGLSDTSAFDAFNRMADKIEDEERRSLAEAEVTEAITGDTVESEFLRLEAGSSDAGLDDRLSALKAEMGILPAAAKEEPRRLGSGGGEGAGESDSGSAQAQGETEDGDAKLGEAHLLEEFERLEDSGGSGARQ